MQHSGKSKEAFNFTLVENFSVIITNVSELKKINNKDYNKNDSQVLTRYFLLSM